MLTILDANELDNQDMTIKQRLRLMKSRKQFAVFIDDDLHLVNDIDRLFFDRLRHESIYNAVIYQIR